MSIIIDNLNHKKTDITPIWLMRQAGRHLPEYRTIRSSFGSLIEMFQNPKICAEVTLQPVERYNLDAAIIFTDILMIHMLTGSKISFDGINGPVVEKNLKPKIDFKNIDFLYQAIKETKSRSNKTLIGFAGGPWTALTYSIFSPTERKDIKKYINEKEKEIDILVKKTTDLTIEYSIKQIDAGINAFQLFESSAGILNDEQLEKWCIEPCKKIFNAIKKYKNIPTIAFPRGVNLENYIKYSFIENLNCLSIDQFFDLNNIYKLNNKIAIQGNLNPETLKVGGDNLKKEVDNILLTFKDRAHIFNLGHGVIKDTPVKNVEDTIKYIRNKK
ncbi:MAG: uroporphyrinogen decarboxylase family protein [Candidatus Pelagibacterales bacterium]|jgi:uroporphyrinogen decarboxylase|tara:strand:- start:3271 stop:4257 length:987 start_codon:yes stop_codon:yes gene_type:complete